MNENEIRDLFRELRDEPVPLESLVRLRVRVEDRIRRRAPWRLAALIGAFAALAIIALIIEIRPTVRKAASPSVALHEPAPAPEEPLPDNLPLNIRPAIERKAFKPRPAPPPQVASIRIETPDPDVVILLVGN
jgi:hypothetical protein